MNQTTSTKNNPGPPRIAVIQAGWHADLLDGGRAAFEAELQRLGHPPGALDTLHVPGAFEIPLQAQTLARAGRHAAILALALVVDGGIYRHDFVAAAVVDGLMRVQLDHGMPIFSMVLTPQAFHGHDEHRRFFAEHLQTKGVEAARAVDAVLALQSAAAAAA